MHLLFSEGDPYLGLIPGPLAFGLWEDVVFAAGGGRGESAVLQFSEGAWRSMPVPQAHGLRAVHPLSATRALVSGERGFLAFVDIADRRVEVLHTNTEACLFDIARDGARFVVGGDEGTWLELDGAATSLRTLGSERVVSALRRGPAWLWLGSRGLHRREGVHDVVVLETSAPLTDWVELADGALLLSGDEGQLWRLEPSGAFTRIPVPVTDDLECLCLAGDRAVIGTSRGALLELSDCVVREVDRLDARPAISALLPVAGGVLVGAWWQTGAPFRLRGHLAFFGSNGEALKTVAPPPRQAIPPRRERTVALGVETFLSAKDGVVVPLEEAKAALPGAVWPDTSLELVRLYRGSVRAATTKALFSETEKGGYAVVVTGDLVVDGHLDAVAGGDGYDSVLMVGGSVWCHSAEFRYGIKASVAGTFECAEVIVCSRGDDGGYLQAERVRARVLAYSTYFPRPEAAELDCFCIGDVYGDEGFPPERAAEVFVPEVLEPGGFNEDALVEALERGVDVVR